MKQYYSQTQWPSVHEQAGGPVPHPSVPSIPELGDQGKAGPWWAPGTPQPGDATKKVIPG